MITSKFEANYSSNSSANHKIGFETVVIANCILNAPLMLLSIVGNALVLVAILKTPSLRSPSVIFLCNLAVSDLLVELVVQPVYIVEQMVKTVPKLQEAVGGMGFAGCGVSLWTMTAITVDRFLALHYHLRYPNLMTTSRAIYTIVTIWCIITLFSFSVLWSPRIHYFLGAFCITICLLVCLVCFIKIYRIVRRHQVQIHVQQQAVENSTDTNKQQIRQSTKSAKNIFIYFLVMILCYTPLFFVYIILINNLNSIVLRTFPVTVAFMNSSINPFLYCWRTPELRRAVFKTARLLFCREMD
ncbi:melanocyte-stimulating hormone receptor-like [Pocillopora verrucosa]|uniref:melanocyte-stimulating hormone receptor-like n=1 Tax=Pocillopora verrucosa TaxID=203993 RepID=UPI003341CF11